MGIIISSCKGESSRKYEEVYKSKLNRPSKREQRFKTYKFSTRSNRSSIRSSKSSLNIHRSQVQNTIPKIIKQTPLNESPLSFKSKSAEVLNRQKIIYQDKSCQVELDSIKYIQTPPRKSKTKAKSKSTSPHSNRNRNKMSHRRHKHIPDFQHRHQHHHHHYHHQIQKEKRILLNLDDGRYSPTFSVFSDMDQEYTNGRIGQSVFSSLYNQGNFLENYLIISFLNLKLI
ncbi:unnamed protein product [Brachionus calyciflorus]|uniref:Uncharacterized protein n=1 Tax=Brachionus calyciflorus TaxID=104777 RepID=A0A813RQR9_9BILA|nr:unnamed protein product [Brachionus calyciflorus]